jgi:hypothetical protein
MYHDLKSRDWWYGMNRAVTEYVALCDNCQRVKVDCQKPAGLLHPLKIPQWKWEEVSMDFIVRLPTTQSGYDSIWVIVYRFLKVAHFIPSRLQGSKVCRVIHRENRVFTRSAKEDSISQRNIVYVNILGKLHEEMDTRLNFSSAYYPQTNGQTKRVNQKL